MPPLQAKEDVARRVSTETPKQRLSEQDREEILLITRGWGWRRVLGKRMSGKRKPKPRLESDP